MNNGVYRCGFSTTQAAYDTAARELHDGLARADAILAGSRFLAGDRWGPPLSWARALMTVWFSV
jgi:putative glutathione S-transferase